MTITKTKNRWEYLGDGVTKAFGFDNIIFEKTDLQVSLDGGAQTVDGHYGVPPAGINNPEGGNILFAVAPALNALVVIERDVPMTQTTNYPENDKFPSKAHERALDKLTILVQQISALLGRSITLEARVLTALASWDAGGRRITGLAAPAGMSDAVNVAHLLETLQAVTAGNFALASELLPGIARFANPAEAAARLDKKLALSVGNFNLAFEPAFNSFLTARPGTEAAAGIVQLASDAVALALADAFKVLTPKGLKAVFQGANVGTNYFKLPSGKIVQWGTGLSTAATANNCAVTFPVTFPTAGKLVLPVITGSGTGNYTVFAGPAGTGGCNLTIQLNGAYVSGVSCAYLAIGD